MVFQSFPHLFKSSRQVHPSPELFCAWHISLQSVAPDECSIDAESRPRRTVISVISGWKQLRLRHLPNLCLQHLVEPHFWERKKLHVFQKFHNFQVEKKHGEKKPWVGFLDGRTKTNWRELIWHDTNDSSLVAPQKTWQTKIDKGWIVLIQISPNDSCGKTGKRVPGVQANL